uniref:SCP domain-containing protein n=1 Tax=Mesocestoides corti TaxID=53468 RepID=A0A5K3EPM1_MESCO
MDKLVCVLMLLSYVVAEAPSQEERDSILEYHTVVRERVQPFASNMKMMSYSGKMESLAVEWAARCKNEETDPATDGTISFTAQNRALFAGNKPTLTDAAYLWYTENHGYNYHRNRCAGNCVRYKQMVWATATELGCAIQRCDNITSYSPKPIYLVVCVYSPIRGYVGRRPYKNGYPCINCPSGYRCSRNQCVKI